MRGERSRRTFWSRRSRKGKAALLGGGILAALLAIGYVLPEEQPEAAGAEATTTGEDGQSEARTTEPGGNPGSPDASVPPPRKERSFRVARVVDGDTLDLTNGTTVRLVQIDTPETGGECYGPEASDVLAGLLPAGTRVRLEADPALDDVDRYGRILRYVFEGRSNINLALVEKGAASVWFFDGDRGRYAERLLAAARKARAAQRGAWASCRAVLAPTRAFETRPKVSGGRAAAGAGGANCAAGYRPCLPVTGDLDCADVEALGRAPVRVTGGDPYRLDGDRDGWGCE